MTTIPTASMSVFSKNNTFALNSHTRTHHHPCQSQLKRQSGRRCGSKCGLDGVFSSFIEPPGDDTPDTKGETNNTKRNERTITNICHGRYEAAADSADNEGNDYDGKVAELAKDG